MLVSGKSARQSHYSLEKTIGHICIQRQTAAKQDITSFTHQVLHAAQRAVGTVERVGQLVHAVVGLAVAIETHSDSRTARKDELGFN